MATWRVNNSTALGGEVCSQWQASHAYSLGARCVCTVAYATTAARAVVFECTTAGTSGGSQPTWDVTVGNTTSDNGATWTTRSPSDGTWDNASCIMFYIVNHAKSAGDTILVCSAHDDTANTGNTTLTFSTTISTPDMVVSVNKDTLELEAGAIVSGSGGAAQWTFAAGYLYSYGVTWKTPTSGYGMSFTNSATINPHFVFESDGTHDVFFPGYAGVQMLGSSDRPIFVEVINGGINLSAVSSLYLDLRFAVLHWRGGVLSLKSDQAYVFLWNYFKVMLEGVDLSSMPAGCELMARDARYDYYQGMIQKLNLRNCKLPSSFSGAYTNTLLPFADYSNWDRVLLHAAGNGSDVSALYEECGQGKIYHERTIVRTGGAADEVGGIALKMVSNANCLEFHAALISPNITKYTTATTEKTYTVEGVFDSAINIQNDEIWLELLYPKNNSDPTVSVTSNRMVALVSPADQATSTEIWTTTGLANPNKFKLSVTVTPGQAGPVTARVYLAKASTTVYIDPLITES